MSTNALLLEVPSLCLAASAIGVAIISFQHTRKKDDTEEIKQTAREMAMVLDKIDGLNNRIGVLETKIDVFWKNVAFDAARILHSPHRPELDRLLDAFTSNAITISQTAELKAVLTEIMNGTVTDFMAGDKVAAAIILRVIEQRGLP
jgi:hypothetical protein